MKRTYRLESEITPEVRKELEALAALSDDDIDTSDIPEITDEQWATARRGPRRRERVEFMVDEVLVDWLKSLPGQGDVSQKITRILWDQFFAARRTGPAP